MLFSIYVHLKLLIRKVEERRHKAIYKLAGSKQFPLGLKVFYIQLFSRSIQGEVKQSGRAVKINPSIRGQEYLLRLLVLRIQIILHVWN